ncbi:hypothetical protein ABT224_19985 [Streptomyces sp. NPDC001584]|uniref:hypothetical protein n=1 Tax=Streptomyces sp. NPDC001584 TaxID=3154521 RepID=UPI003324A8AF
MTAPITIDAAKAEIHLHLDTLYGGEEHDHIEHLLDGLIAAAIAEHTAAPPPATD